MKWPIWALLAAVILLLVADLLAFHDLFEAHTVTDWLMLAGSALAVVALAGATAGRLGTISRGG